VKHRLRDFSFPVMVRLSLFFEVKIRLFFGLCVILLHVHGLILAFVLVVNWLMFLGFSWQFCIVYQKQNIGLIMKNLHNFVYVH
jgi:hypothetical protein